MKKRSTSMLLIAMLLSALGYFAVGNAQARDTLSILEANPKARLTTKERETLPAEPPAEWLACVSMIDCTVVRGAPCKWATVNTKFTKQFELYNTYRYNLDLIEYDCPQLFKDTPQPVAECINQRCVISGSTR